jgi:hypothetical protein
MAVAGSNNLEFKTGSRCSSFGLLGIVAARYYFSCRYESFTYMVSDDDEGHDASNFRIDSLIHIGLIQGGFGLVQSSCQLVARNDRLGSL